MQVILSTRELQRILLMQRSLLTWVSASAIICSMMLGSGHRERTYDNRRDVDVHDVHGAHDDNDNTTIYRRRRDDGGDDGDDGEDGDDGSCARAGRPPEVSHWGAGQTF